MRGRWEGREREEKRGGERRRERGKKPEERWREEEGGGGERREMKEGRYAPALCCGGAQERASHTRSPHIRQADPFQAMSDGTPARVRITT